MRCFVSVPVPVDVRDDLDRYLEPRRVAKAGVRWGDPARWHLTLAFMPDVAEVDLDDLSERLEAACARRRPIRLRLGGGGVFGSPLAARVLWVGVPLDAADRDELDRIALGARNAGAAAGTVVEGGRFVPHVTVARTARPRDVRRLLDVLDLYESPDWEVDAVDLVSSELGGGTARHEVLGSFRLGPPADDRWWSR